MGVRGDLVTIALQGSCGKPRPGLIIQTDFMDLCPSVVILPISSDLKDTPLIRVTIIPDDENNLKKTSQIMLDKITAIPKDKVGPVFGKLNDKTLLEVNRGLSFLLGIST